LTLSYFRVPDSLQAVPHHVDQYLINLNLVRRHLAGLAPGIKLYYCVTFLHFMFKKNYDAPYELVNFQEFPLAVPLANKFPKMPDDVSGTMRLLSGPL
jgi:hypothetical protein